MGNTDCGKPCMNTSLYMNNEINFFKNQAVIKYDLQECESNHYDTVNTQNNNKIINMNNNEDLNEKESSYSLEIISQYSKKVNQMKDNKMSFKKEISKDAIPTKMGNNISLTNQSNCLKERRNISSSEDDSDVSSSNMRAIIPITNFVGSGEGAINNECNQIVKNKIINKEEMKIEKNNNISICNNAEIKSKNTDEIKESKMHVIPDSINFTNRRKINASDKSINNKEYVNSRNDCLKETNNINLFINTNSSQKKIINQNTQANTENLNKLTSSSKNKVEQYQDQIQKSEELIKSDKKSKNKKANQVHPLLINNNNRCISLQSDKLLEFKVTKNEIKNLKAELGEREFSASNNITPSNNLNLNNSNIKRKESNSNPLVDNLEHENEKINDEIDNETNNVHHINCKSISSLNNGNNGNEFIKKRCNNESNGLTVNQRNINTSVKQKIDTSSINKSFRSLKPFVDVKKNKKKKEWNDFVITDVIPESKLFNPIDNDILLTGDFLKINVYNKENNNKSSEVAVLNFFLLTHKEIKIYNSIESYLFSKTPLLKIPLKLIVQCDTIDINETHYKYNRNILKYNFYIKLNKNDNEMKSTRKSNRFLDLNSKTGIKNNEIRIINNKIKKMKLLNVESTSDTNDKVNLNNYGSSKIFPTSIINSSNDKVITNQWICAINYFISK